MQKYSIYIGQNNKTKKLEKEKAIDIVSSYFKGFSAFEIIGFWKGEKEKTLKVEIVSEKKEDVKVTRMCKELQKKLEQDSIMFESVISNIVFIE